MQDLLTRPHPLYARVYFAPIPWQRVAFEGTALRCLEQKFPERAMLRNPADDNPRFWREVRQLFFALQNGDTATVCAFYGRYGPLGSLSDAPAEWEDLNEVRRRLDWFRELTAMLEWIKARKAGPLRERFERAHKLQGGGAGPWFLYGLGAEGTSPAEDLYIAWRPWPRAAATGPANDDELFAAAWSALEDAVADALRHITMLPGAEPRLQPPPRPLSTLVFIAPGAFAAAFMQWWLQEVAPVNVVQCAAPDCHNPVLPPRVTYCSERCREREKKRRQRQSRRVMA